MRTRRERHALRSGTGARAALVIEYDPTDDGRAWFSGSWDETGLPITGFSRTVLLERWSDGGWRAASIREGSRTPLDAALAWLEVQGEDLSPVRGNPSGRRTSFRSRADALRYEAAERAAAISVLGMEPEIPGDRYAATLGELVRWVREAGLEDQMNEEARRIHDGASPQSSRRRRRNGRFTAAGWQEIPVDRGWPRTWVSGDGRWEVEEHPVGYRIYLRSDTGLIDDRLRYHVADSLREAQHWVDRYAAREGRYDANLRPNPHRGQRRRNDRLTAAERHDLPDRYFAVPENEGLPIDTKGRLRAAMARFDQYVFDSKAQVDRAFRNILRRAKQLKVDASRFKGEFESGEIVAKIAR